jgi:hypothetical protein
MRKTTLIALMIFLAAIHPLSAQPIGAKANPQITPLSFLASSLVQSDTSTAPVTDDSLSAPFHQSKSTLLAMGLSALLPGAGQIYNESYWKTPIIMGLGGWLVYEWVQNNNLFKDYRDQYQASITPTVTRGNSRLLSIREFYRDQRDGFAWYLGLLYAINILDAYVDASLFDFHQDSKAVLHPIAQPNGMAINLKLSF